MSLLSQKYIKVQYSITIGALIFLCIVVLFNSNPPLFDEILFVRNMDLFKEYGLSRRFLTEMYDQAPGPLYQIVHSLAEPLTGIKTPQIRLLNFGLFLFVIVNTYLILRNCFGWLENKYLLALNLVCVPVVWQVAGMALTEMPAMFLATSSFLILSIIIRRLPRVDALSIGLAFFGGICLGGAILGRTPYLMLVVALLVLVYNPLADKTHRSTLPVGIAAIFLVCSLCICLPVFFVWKGLVPPHQATISQGGLKIWHGVLAFAYSGIIALLVSPRWFKINSKVVFLLLILTVVFFILNLFWWEVKYYPFYYFLAGILPRVFMIIYPYLISPILMTFASYFSWNLGLHMLEHRNNAYYQLIAASLILVLVTCINIKHLFSSRYVAQAVPFLVVLVADKDDVGMFKLVRILIGVAIGYISLQTYLNPSS